MTLLSTAFSLVIGLPLGVLLVAGDKDGILPLPGWLKMCIRDSPNTIVEDGQCDTNYFQHQPYLDNFNEEKGTHRCV